VLTLPKVPRDPPQQIEYATPPEEAVDRRFLLFGVFGLIYGALSLAMSASMIKSSVQSIESAKRGIAQHWAGTYYGEYSNLYEFGTATCAIGAVLSILAGLLLFAAILLLLKKPASIPLHCFYAICEVITCIVWAQKSMNFVYHSPGGPMFYMGAIPAAIGCIYPVLLLVALCTKELRT
jgi:hypothetical protein